MPSLPDPTLMTPRGTPHGQSTEEKTEPWIIDGSVCYEGTTWKGRAAVLLPLYGMSLKGSVEGKSFQWTENWAQDLVIHFTGKKKWTYMWLHIESHTMTKRVIQWSGTWKEHIWKTGSKSIWVRDMQLCLSKWTKNMNIFVSHMNAHQSLRRF